MSFRWSLTQLLGHAFSPATTYVGPDQVNGDEDAAVVIDGKKYVLSAKAERHFQMDLQIAIAATPRAKKSVSAGIDQALRSASTFQGPKNAP